MAFKIKRVNLVVLDGVGVGYLPDAKAYGDEGANTMAHVFKKEKVLLPNMAAIGLGQIPGAGYPENINAKGAYGKCREQSPGKDTTTGHWEMAGIKLSKPFPTFPNGFPKALIYQFEEAIGRKTLGNYAASGTEIIKELGEEHLQTGYPIVYTSADSVFQIACHEKIYNKKELYDICEIARDLLVGDYAVGRVIARPFAGEPGHFVRTADRRDFSVIPPSDTLLDILKSNGLDVIGVGKIEDIFANRGLTQSNHAAGNINCIDALIDFLKKDFTGLVFTNLVDFDMVYGHRNDTKGFADALAYFDSKLLEIQSLMQAGDLLIITADHGCDPVFEGTDHTREYTPLLCWYPGMNSLVDLGIRNTFADIAATVCEAFEINKRFGATSFYDQLGYV